MPVGSHKDAFKAHQLVKKLAANEPTPVLAKLSADIILNFVKNQRQVSSDFVIVRLPEDDTRYDPEKLDKALEAVESLCGKCAENHANACFINQTRRILIFAKTRIDPGSDFDGKKSLEEILQSSAARVSPREQDEFPAQSFIHEKENIPEGYDDLRRKYEDLLERDIFRSTLISEIVKTIRSVSEGHFEAEMPVHDDPQLGQLATAFNLMLGTVNKTMNHLDCLVIERTSELNTANEALKASVEKYHQINLRLNETLDAAEKANRRIIESIRYANMIQCSLLPNPENIKSFLSDSFFIWMPRDIVGGDFIFTNPSEDGFILAVIDCTGHGVPGAFMTMITDFGLRKIIRDEGWRDPAQILRRLNFFVKTSLQQDTDYALSDDGLDAAVVCIRMPDSNYPLPAEPLTLSDSQPLSLTFAGAKLPLFYTCRNEVHVIKGGRQSIGYRRSDLGFNFTNHTIAVEKGMSFYMATDGFADQLGETAGNKVSRLGTRRLRELLKENSPLPFDIQREKMLEAFNIHKGDMERQDDVTMIGFGF